MKRILLCLCLSIAVAVTVSGCMNPAALPGGIDALCVKYGGALYCN